MLGTDYLDLYLIHWYGSHPLTWAFFWFPTRPIAFKKEGTNILDEDLTADPYPTWQRLEELVDKGKIRNIGISKWVLSLSSQTGADMLPIASISEGLNNLWYSKSYSNLSFTNQNPEFDREQAEVPASCQSGRAQLLEPSTWTIEGMFPVRARKYLYSSSWAIRSGRRRMGFFLRHILPWVATSKSEILSLSLRYHFTSRGLDTVV
jgi:hypothetical protein